MLVPVVANRVAAAAIAYTLVVRIISSRVSIVMGLGFSEIDFHGFRLIYRVGVASVNICG